MRSERLFPILVCNLFWTISGQTSQYFADALLFVKRLEFLLHTE